MEKPKAFAKLTWAALERFIGRKKSDLLGLICDTKAEEVYPVPVNVEHIDWAAAILRVDKQDIRNDPSIASHLVPSVVQFSPTHDEVTGILTGTSGMEMGYGVRHTQKQLDTAHAMAQAFVFRGEIPQAESEFLMDVVRRWQTKAL